MVLFEITLFPLVENLREADSGILSPFYADNAVFDGSVRRTAQLLKLYMDRGAYRGCFPQYGQVDAYLVHTGSGGGG